MDMDPDEKLLQLRMAAHRDYLTLYKIATQHWAPAYFTDESFAAILGDLPYDADEVRLIALEFGLIRSWPWRVPITFSPFVAMSHALFKKIDMTLEWGIFCFTEWERDRNVSDQTRSYLEYFDPDGELLAVAEDICHAAPNQPIGTMLRVSWHMACVGTTITPAWHAIEELVRLQLQSVLQLSTEQIKGLSPDQIVMKWFDDHPAPSGG